MQAALQARVVPLTRAVALTPVVDLLGRVGAPVARLLRSAGLTASMLSNSEALVPVASAARLLALGAHSLGIESLGLRAGETLRPESLGMFGRIVGSRCTFGDALETLIADSPTFTTGSRFWLAPHGDDHLELCHAIVHDLEDGREQADHYGLMFLLAVLRLAAGPTWQPTDVRAQTGESTAVRTASAFSAASITFEQPASAIVFPRALLDHPMRASGNRTLVSAHSVEKWKASGPARDLAGSIVQVMNLLPHDPFPSIQVTAGAAGMSVRNLQRHLTTVGLTHTRLVARARLSSAARLLEETDTKVVDIALDLGYSDHAHFTRAFRTWTGRSPREFRRARRPDVEAARPAGGSAVTD